MQPDRQRFGKGRRAIVDGIGNHHEPSGRDAHQRREGAGGGEANGTASATDVVLPTAAPVARAAPPARVDCDPRADRNLDVDAHRNDAPRELMTERERRRLTSERMAAGPDHDGALGVLVQISAADPAEPHLHDRLTQADPVGLWHLLEAQIARAVPHE
ncbi:MAG: hypothetical protein Q8K58_04485 [Acidimicrobiales bacterium]|nr:hypothetical protein [Acidimicrobiales bacterium]